METTTEQKVKTYVLLDHLDANAPIYQRVNKDQRVRLQKRPVDHAYLRVVFANEKGENRQLRLKLQTNEIDFQKQVKDLGIPANEPFTQAEKDAVRFSYGSLTTTNKTVQNFLESGPQIDSFKGTWADGRPMFKLFDPTIQIMNDNLMFKKRLEVANMIAELDLVEAQDLMLRLNGVHFKPPATIEECQNGLVDYMDDIEDEKGLEAMMKKELNVDEEARLVLSRSILAGIISFDEIPNEVARKNGSKWASVKTIASDLPAEDRQMYFVQYLTSPEGRLLFNDLKNQVKTKVKKP